MNTLEILPEMKFVQTRPGFKVVPHPAHKRLYHVELNQERLQEFLRTYADIGPQNLEYVPYMRYVLAGRMKELFGEELEITLRDIMHDRETGGFTIGMQGSTGSTDDYVKFGTAIAHLVGSPNFDSMSGKYYARFTVSDTDNSDSYLRQAYRLFTLHTDGTYVDEKTDWLIMMKMEEMNAVGGESRLLHLDDWEELDKFAKHPLASYKFTYKSSSSKNVEKIVQRETFFQSNNGTCICFIDQFACPENVEQSVYLKEMSESMENSPATHALKLPVGNLIMVNNLFWVHGRAAFEKHPDLYRELMRLRGEFAKV